MSDYMKEAERLIEEYGNAEWKVGKMSEHSDDAEEIVTRENARAALLAHIQRGAVPKGWQVVPSADQLWNNDEVMALNVELGLTLDQMSRLVRAALRGEVKP